MEVRHAGALCSERAARNYAMAFAPVSGVRREADIASELRTCRDASPDVLRYDGSAVKPRVGFLGAYSIDNPGDLLIGAATRQQVRARVACEEHLFAVDFPQPLWRHDWSAQRGLGLPIHRVAPDAPHVSTELDALIIGGGGLLLPVHSFRPFRAWGDTPAAWNALCSQGTPTGVRELGTFYAEIRSACERLRYVSVRNDTTARLLRSSGYDGELAIVPDPAIVYAPERAPMSRERGRPRVALSVGNAFNHPAAAPFFAKLSAELERLAAADLVELLVIPFGRIYGDVEIATRAAARMPHAQLVGADASADEIWQLVGSLDLFVCTRLHAVIAAYAQGVPFLACDEYIMPTTGTSKLRDFVVARNLAGSHMSPFAERDPAGRVAAALADTSHRAAAGQALEADRQALAIHFDRMVAALGLPRS